MLDSHFSDDTVSHAWNGTRSNATDLVLQVDEHLSGILGQVALPILSILYCRAF